MKKHLTNITNKIKKAIKIIRNEGFPAFAGKLTRRIVYGTANAVAAAFLDNKRHKPSRPALKSRFTEKKVIHGARIKDEGAKAERFFEDIKEDILRAIDK